jgi:thioredoxin reductase
VKSDDAIVIIGAGPYGLSVAAHLRARRLPVRVFGKTMEFWEKMPDGMHLKSIWSASSLSDPARNYTLDRYAAAGGIPKREPIPLPDFVTYGHWFQRHAVPEVDSTYVRNLARDGARFRLELEDGRSVSAPKVIVAAGIDAFATIPPFARGLPPELASHTRDHKDFARYRGQAVAVLGRGQSAVQTAAFLHEAGAAVVEILARGPVIWVNRKLYRLTGPAKHIFYPPSDVGPAGLSWLIHSPLLYRKLSDVLRARIEERATRPAGAPWLKHRVIGLVRETGGVEIERATPRGNRLELALSDGSIRSVDHLFVATGFHASLDSLSFLDAGLRTAVQAHQGAPELSPWFEASVPNLYFAGAVAHYNFGPICRFVAGARISSRQIAQHSAATLSEALHTASDREPVVSST